MPVGENKGVVLNGPPGFGMGHFDALKVVIHKDHFGVCMFAVI
jgi:hypothetical protein